MSKKNTQVFKLSNLAFMLQIAIITFVMSTLMPRAFGIAKQKRIYHCWRDW